MKKRLQRMRREASDLSDQKRKQDTRQKIELGGLIVKAGLRECDKAVLYAGLLELADRLHESREFDRLRTLGKTLLRPG